DGTRLHNARRREAAEQRRKISRNTDTAGKRDGLHTGAYDWPKRPPTWGSRRHGIRGELDVGDRKRLAKATRPGGTHAAHAFRGGGIALRPRRHRSTVRRHANADAAAHRAGAAPVAARRDATRGIQKRAAARAP